MIVALFQGLEVFIFNNVTQVIFAEGRQGITCIQCDLCLFVDAFAVLDSSTVFIVLSKLLTPPA